MKCPNCGYNRQKRDDAFVPATECPSCGIVYSKHEGKAVPGLPLTAAAPPPPPSRQSALDPETLKKAKERVEKRLRNRIEAPIRDERHAQTLELARKLTKRSTPPQQEHVTGPQISKVEIVSREMEQFGRKPDEEPQTEEVLELEEAIGVQIHNGKTHQEALETTDEEKPERSAEADDTGTEEVISANEATPEDSYAAATAASDPEKPKQAKADESETGEPEAEKSESGEPEAEESEIDRGLDDEVHSETIILESSERDIEVPVEEEPESHEAEAAEKESLQHVPADAPPAYVAAASTSLGATDFGSGLKRLLPVVAWMILFSGIIGAVLSWTTINNVEAGVGIPVAEGPNTLPIGLLLGFAYLATGALGFAFFWVSSLISRQLGDIRRLLMLQSCASDSDTAASTTTR